MIKSSTIKISVEISNSPDAGLGHYGRGDIAAVARVSQSLPSAAYGKGANASCTIPLVLSVIASLCVDDDRRIVLMSEKSRLGSR